MMLNARSFAIAASMATVWLAASRLTAAHAGAKDIAKGDVYAVIDIDALGAENIAALKQRVAPRWSVEADAALLVLADPGKLAAAGRSVRILPTTPDPRQLFIINVAHDSLLENLEADVLVRGGRRAVVQANTGYLESRVKHPTIDRFETDAKGDLVLAQQLANAEASGEKKSIAFSDTIVRAVEAVDGARWLSDVETLARLNRYTLGPQIVEARDLLVRSFEDIGLDVTVQQFTVRGTPAWNVIATWRGKGRPDDWYVVGAHYDAISERSSSTAPGAEDNGSGTAGLLEMARHVVTAQPASTVIFVAFSGEEQGLHGATAHATRLVADGDKDKVKAVINMDMIGYTSDADLDVLLESDRRGSALFPVMQAAAQRFTTLRVVTTLNPWGSDHVPYIDRGIPALLTIENDWSSYPAYHRSGDTPDKLSQAMGEEILKMNLAALLQMADGAP